MFSIFSTLFLVEWPWFGHSKSSDCSGQLNMYCIMVHVGLDRHNVVLYLVILVHVD